MRDQIRAHYDRCGSRQDGASRYSDAAYGELVGLGVFSEAQNILEFGCGTGRAAGILLTRHLPLEARYLACDLSATMTALARSRLEEFGGRALVVRGDLMPALAAAHDIFDLVLTGYVLDLLSEDDIRFFLKEARRVLADEGKLCLVGLTLGMGIRSRAKMALWRLVYAIRPLWVGGCRPLDLRLLVSSDWRIEHHRLVEAAGMPSQVLVLSPTGKKAHVEPHRMNV